MKRVAFEELLQRIERVLLRLGLPVERAALCARLIAETDRDGIRTHGIARLPRFVEMVRLGRIDIHGAPERVAGTGALERWTAHRGPGNLAAYVAMQRAMQLAGEYGIGCVALAETTHWMRAGTYGWQAADAGFAAMCWTNTLPNVPPWGAKTPALGNNPLVVAIPHSVAERSEAIVLDMAMSQFSYGTLAKYSAKGEALPVPGGYDEHGELTTDAAAVERSQRALPIGFWKGSGLSFVLDVLAAALAGGCASHDFSNDPLQEVGQSQVFLAIAPQAVASLAEMHRVAQGAIDALHAAVPIEAGKPARYPGEGVLQAREESLRLGVAVEDVAWQKFLVMEDALVGSGGAVKTSRIQ